MIHAHDIKGKIAAFLRGDISLSSFERWVAVESGDIFSDSADEAIRLVAACNLLISELHDDIIEASEFRSELGEIISHSVISVHFDERLNPAEPSWTFNPREQERERERERELEQEREREQELEQELEQEREPMTPERLTPMLPAGQETKA